jgi:hypothetical protein
VALVLNGAYDRRKAGIPMNELVAKWTVERAEIEQMLEALEGGRLHFGNPWEGRDDAKMADLGRKIKNLDQLIERENTHRT